MAILNYYLDSTSTGGDGTTPATSGANAAFATLSAFSSAIVNKDLVSRGDTINLFVAAGTYTEGFSDSAWTTDATNFLHIQASAGNYCTKTDFSDGVRFVDSSLGSTGLFALTGATRLTGLGIHNTGTSSSTRGVQLNNADCIVDSCIVRGGASSTSDGIFLISNGGQVYNTIAVGAVRNNFYVNNFVTGTIHGCGSVDAGDTGFFRNGTGGTEPELINCWSINSTNADYSAGTTWAVSSATNASGDGTAPGTGSITGITLTEFLNPGSNDYSLATGSQLIGAGTTVSNTNSINEQTRTPPFDIGPFVYVAPSNQIPVADAGGDQLLTKVGDILTLDGTGSSDVDGTVTAYSWTLDSKPASSTATLTTPTASIAGLTPDVEGEYTVSLVVTDNDAANSVADTITIVAADVAFKGSELPTSGDDVQSVWFEGGLVTLPADNNNYYFVESYTQPSNGSVVMQENGAFTYFPNTGYTGSDSFTFTYQKNGITQPVETVNITVGSSGPFTITPNVIASTVTFYSPTVSTAGGPFTISPSTIGSTVVFFTPVVTGGATPTRIGVSPRISIQWNNFKRI